MVWILSPPGVSSARAKSRRASASVVLVGAAVLDVLDGGGELRVGERRPFAEDVEDALRHLGGGGAGEGQAEDAAGVGAGEEQADDAVGEHMGLARAGIGRHPGRGARVRGVGLRLPRRGVDG